MTSPELIEAFITHEAGSIPTAEHWSALVSYLKTTAPANIQRDWLMSHHIEQLSRAGLRLYAQDYGAICLVADRFKVSESSAERAWQKYRNICRNLPESCGRISDKIGAVELSEYRTRIMEKRIAKEVCPSAEATQDLEKARQELAWLYITDTGENDELR